jgi:hypothetical protein
MSLGDTDPKIMHSTAWRLSYRSWHLTSGHLLTLAYQKLTCILNDVCRVVGSGRLDTELVVSTTLSMVSSALEGMTVSNMHNSPYSEVQVIFRLA